MKLIKYRTIAEVYPYLSLEAMVQLKNGEVVYTNISVNNRGEKKMNCEDTHWTYKKPLPEVDWENVENDTYDLSREEDQEVCNALLDLWNTNPVFDNDRSWKLYIKKNKTLFDRARNIRKGILESRLVARMETEGRELTDEETLSELKYIRETFQHSGYEKDYIKEVLQAVNYLLKRYA